MSTAAKMPLTRDDPAEALPGSISRPKLYRQPGEGELHGWGAPLVRDDALIEMLVVAECDALIRYPPASFFTFYAAVMRRHGSTRPKEIRDLECPFAADDGLSPPVLI